MSCLYKIPVVLATLVTMWLICAFHVKLESIYIPKNLVDSTCFFSVSLILTIMFPVFFSFSLKNNDVSFHLFNESLFACSQP